ncbi:hypothetical protein [Cognatiyoonia sp. IB215182]|uniref:hypothetical protein n=1 Tax=Cognatiyoonia sp. IB215182 TaxID=3097353 RepID=UPI002A0B61AC|nr:hypothetical protein [Cognatiyoonia sp. IB215182]MDX8351905.1 hypothetical protein [Cognatiyoonia sp. IB215182]
MALWFPVWVNRHTNNRSGHFGLRLFAFIRSGQSNSKPINDSLRTNLGGERAPQARRSCASTHLFCALIALGWVTALR